VITGGGWGGGNKTTLKEWTAEGNDPGSRQINAWPSVSSIIGWAEEALGNFDPPAGSTGAAAAYR
jgi:hypothetical protein